MKKIFIIGFLTIMVLLISCSEDNPTNTAGIKKYPSDLGNEWEYNTNTTIEYYDTLGNIIDVDNLDLGNTIAKIIKTDDTLGSYNNLVKYECYDSQTPNFKSYDWYSNSDTSFLLIAYTNAGASQPVIPKINGRRYLTDQELISLIRAQHPAVNLLLSQAVLDSIYFYEVPRQVLAYPLTINKRWVELINPWYRERYVADYKTQSFQGHPVNCFVIKVNWPNYEIEINDYISLELGLIKREILADSVIITTPANPDSGGFGRFSSSSNLVRISE